MNTVANNRFSRARVAAAASAISLSAAILFGNPPAHAQPPQNSAGEAPVSERLSGQQDSIARRVAELETLLLRSSELEAAENPTRASLLRRAVQLSKQVKLASTLAAAAEQLGEQQYSDAIAQQKLAKKNLAEILTLLQSENRGERVRREREQVRRWIEETDRLLRMQGALRGRTEGGQELDAARRNQEQLKEKASEIADDLLGEKTDPSKPPERDESKQNESEPSKQEPGSERDQQPGAAERDSQGQETQEDSTDQDPNSQSSDSQQSGTPSSGSPSGGDPKESSEQQAESEQSNSEQSDDESQEEAKSPTQKAGERLRQAQQKMQQAQEELEDAKRDGAVEKQREAEQELRDAVAELEQILQQLREEEIERSLETLEARLRTMLSMQTRIVEETRRLSEISTPGEPNRQIEIRASKLSLEEQKVLRAGERAFSLLREEGSSAAFPEAIEQVNADISDVVQRLSSGDVSALTIVIEEDIVSALEEMVGSLVAVQKENREKKQSEQKQGGGGGNPGQQGERPLVNKLAELRLVKTLQMRINRRTESMSKLLDGSDASDTKGQVTEQEVLDQVRELAKRELKIQKVTLKIAGDQTP